MNDGPGCERHCLWRRRLRRRLLADQADLNFLGKNGLDCLMQQAALQCVKKRNMQSNDGNQRTVPS
jgi:hypothetical protein